MTNMLIVNQKDAKEKEIFALIEEIHDSSLIEESHVTHVYHDGEVNSQKGGSLYQQRTVFCFAPALLTQTLLSRTNEDELARNERFNKNLDQAIRLLKSKSYQPPDKKKYRDWYNKRVKPVIKRQIEYALENLASQFAEEDCGWYNRDYVKYLMKGCPHRHYGDDDFHYYSMAREKGRKLSKKQHNAIEKEVRDRILSEVQRPYNVEPRNAKGPKWSGVIEWLESQKEEIREEHEDQKNYRKEDIYSTFPWTRKMPKQHLSDREPVGYLICTSENAKRFRAAIVEWQILMLQIKLEHEV